MEEYVLKCQQIISEKNRFPLVFLHSFGCVQNVSDGENILGILREIGYNITYDLNSADLIIYNTCAIRESAELKAFGIIGELKHIKDKNPDVIIAVCGCMIGEEHNVAKIKSSYKQVDFVFGTSSIRKMPELLYNTLNERRFYCENSEFFDDFVNTIPVRANTFKANVPIVYGCDNFCSYCIVPYVRGREKSRPVAEILSEVKQLVSSGYKEIMLLGQNVNSYGKSFGYSTNFAELLSMIEKIEGDFKIRFLSPHPKDVTKELLDVILNSEKICKHIHLPLQSGSNEILSKMNRRYTSEDYLKIVEYLRQKDPYFSISTDIIVGFPNETEEDFDATMEIIEKVRFTNVFSFIYSIRKGTAAALMDDKTKRCEKDDRMSRLLKRQREISTENHNRYLDKTVEILIDDINDDGLLYGKTEEFITVLTSCGDKNLIGKRCNVKITKVHNWALYGNIL